MKSKPYAPSIRATVRKARRINRKAIEMNKALERIAAEYAGWNFNLDEAIAHCCNDCEPLQLLIDSHDNPMEDRAGFTRSVGFWVEGEDKWMFAGWDWDNDAITSGYGTVVAWAPMLPLKVKE